MCQKPSSRKIQNLEESSRGYGDDANPKMEHIVNFFFGTISPKRGIHSPLLVDILCEVLEQMPNFGITRENRLSELMLPEEAQAWLDEFMEHIRGKNEDLSGSSNFHVNMTYVLSAMFCAERLLRG